MQPLELHMRLTASMTRIMWLIQHPEEVTQMTNVIDKTFRGIVNKRMAIALRELEKKRG